jgi:hypothetical protein
LGLAKIQAVVNLDDDGDGDDDDGDDGGEHQDRYLGPVINSGEPESEAPPPRQTSIHQCNSNTCMKWARSRGMDGNVDNTWQLVQGHDPPIDDDLREIDRSIREGAERVPIEAPATRSGRNIRCLDFESRARSGKRLRGSQ